MKDLEHNENRNCRNSPEKKTTIYHDTFWHTMVGNNKDDAYTFQKINERIIAIPYEDKFGPNSPIVISFISHSVNMSMQR